VSWRAEANENLATGYDPRMAAPNTVTPNGVRRRGRPLGAASRLTRERILTVAREVIVEGCFAQASARQIAERAGVDSALIQYYFGSKEGLRDEVVDLVVAEHAAALAALDDGQGTTAERTRKVIHGYAVRVSEHPVAARLLVREVLHAAESGEPPRCERVLNRLVLPLLETLGKIHMEGRQTGAWEDTRDPRAVTGAIAMACIGLVLAEPLVRLGSADGVGVDLDLGRSWTKLLPSLFLDGLLPR
jgi:AcrR family transcriptional regulator